MREVAALTARDDGPMTDVNTLTEQEARLVFDRFDQDDAWCLGALLVDKARSQGHPLLIDIRKPGLVLFRAALPGSAPDQQVWAEGKANVVLRLETSSGLFAARMAEAGVDPRAIGWLDDSYAVTGGSFPIRVKGVGVVAAVTASGLTSDEDHAFVVAAIEEFLAG